MYAKTLPSAIDAALIWGIGYFVGTGCATHGLAGREWCCSTVTSFRPCVVRHSSHIKAAASTGFRAVEPGRARFLAKYGQIFGLEVLLAQPAPENLAKTTTWNHQILQRYTWNVWGEGSKKVMFFFFNRKVGEHGYLMLFVCFGHMFPLEIWQDNG